MDTELKIVSYRDNRQPNRGASLVEYALILALIATVALPAVDFLGRKVNEQFLAISVGAFSLFP